MKIQFGSIIVAGSGKIGGHVAARNRAGAYMRTKVSPMNPNTSFQATVRNRLSTIATSWKALTSAQILNWNNAVSNFKKSDLFGNMSNPSGFNLFQKLNNNLSRVGVAAITTPPLPVAIPVIVTGTLASVHAGAMTITFTSDPVVTASKVMMSATPPQSIGKAFVKSEFREIGLMPTLAAHVATITTEYNAKFGAPPVAGQKIFVKLQQISNVTGQAGIPVIYDCVTT